MTSQWIDIGILAEDQWFYVMRDVVEFPDGRVGGYIRWVNRKSEEGSGFNSVLMCVQGDRVLMLRKFRHEERIVKNGQLSDWFSLWAYTLAKVKKLV